MKALLTVSRLRSVISGAMTEKDVVSSLRRHRIRYRFTTAPGFLCIRVPLRSGSADIVRTASRSVPFSVRSAAPADYPYPLPRWTWDD